MENLPDLIDLTTEQIEHIFDSDVDNEADNNQMYVDDSDTEQPADNLEDIDTMWLDGMEYLDDYIANEDYIAYFAPNENQNVDNERYEGTMVQGMDYTIQQFKQMDFPNPGINLKFEGKKFDCDVLETDKSKTNPVVVQIKSFNGYSKHIYCGEELLRWLKTGKNTDVYTNEEILKVKFLTMEEINIIRGIYPNVAEYKQPQCMYKLKF